MIKMKKYAQYLKQNLIKNELKKQLTHFDTFLFSLKAIEIL